MASLVEKLRGNKMPWAETKQGGDKTESQIELPIGLLIHIIHTMRHLSVYVWHIFSVFMFGSYS